MLPRHPEFCCDPAHAQDPLWDDLPLQALGHCGFHSLLGTRYSYDFRIVIGAVQAQKRAQIAETAKRVRALEADASSNTFLAVLARADQALGEIQAMNSVTKHDWAQKLGDLLAAIR